VLSGPERHLPAARFSVLGEGLLSPALERDTRELVSSGRLRFLGEVDDPATFLSEAHVLVMPSHNEGLPYALLEAMAAGLAVVAYGVGGIPEVVEDSSLGRLVRPRDFDSLVAAVKGLMEDRPGLHALGARASLHVAEKYTLESRREPMLELYERVGGQRWA
jgi:glycosyltransferase involved in cell wall biosynthesis